MNNSSVAETIYPCCCNLLQIYKLLPGRPTTTSPSPRVFYDPRCGGFRTKLEFTVIDTAPPQSISAVFKEGMVCRPFSITISKKKQDIPTAYFPSAMTFLESVSVKGFFGGERGAREKRLHLQGCVWVWCYLESDHTKDLSSAIRSHFHVRPNEGTQIMVKIVEHKNGDLYTLGYCQKYAGHADYKPVNYGLTDRELEGAREYYDAKKPTTMTTATRLEFKNLHVECKAFYRARIYPAPVPNLNTMLSFMISTGEYMPVTKFTVNGQGNCLDWQNAQLLWEALMAPEMVTRADTARLFFRCSDPGDHGAPARR